MNVILPNVGSVVNIPQRSEVLMERLLKRDLFMRQAAIFSLVITKRSSWSLKSTFASLIVNFFLLSGFGSFRAFGLNLRTDCLIFRTDEGIKH